MDYLDQWLNGFGTPWGAAKFCAFWLSAGWIVGGLI